MIRQHTDVIRKALDRLDPPCWGGPDMTEAYEALRQLDAIEALLSGPTVNGIARPAPEPRR